MKKKGFTLIELLAVIVILGIILVIAVPRIVGVITSSRKDSFESSVHLLAQGIKTEAMVGKFTTLPVTDASCKTSVSTVVTDAVRYNPADFGDCKYTITEDFKVTVTASGAASGKFGTQTSITVTK